MSTELFGGLGRDFVEMIDEWFNKPVRQWTSGTWVFGIIVVGILGFFLSLIAEYIVVPLWQFSLWLSAGKGWVALQQVNASIIFKTLVFFGFMVFLVAGGFVAVRNLSWAALSVWKDKRSLRKQIAESLVDEPRWRRLTFWPMMLGVVVVVGFMYVVLGYWMFHQMAHDVGFVAQLRAALVRCLPAESLPPPARLDMPAEKPLKKPPV